jgi:hypothetical protein
MIVVIGTPCVYRGRIAAAIGGAKSLLPRCRNLSEQIRNLRHAESEA